MDALNRPTAPRPTRTGSTPRCRRASIGRLANPQDGRAVGRRLALLLCLRRRPLGGLRAGAHRLGDVPLVVGCVRGGRPARAGDRGAADGCRDVRSADRVGQADGPRDRREISCTGRSGSCRSSARALDASPGNPGQPPVPGPALGPGLAAKAALMSTCRCLQPATRWCAESRNGRSAVWIVRCGRWAGAVPHETVRGAQRSCHRRTVESLAARRTTWLQDERRRPGLRAPGALRLPWSRGVSAARVQVAAVGGERLGEDGDEDEDQEGEQEFHNEDLGGGG